MSNSPRDHSRLQAAAERNLTDQTNLQLSRARLLTVFAALSLALLISFVDQNGIGVTLPTIAADLEAGDTIPGPAPPPSSPTPPSPCSTAACPTSLAAKPCFSGLWRCSASRRCFAVYFFRALAGIGGGGISNCAMIIVSDIVTLERRGKYQGFIGSCVGLGNIIGPFLAAAYISRGGPGSWRAFFWTTAPITALMGVIGWFLIPGMPPKLQQEKQKQQQQQNRKNKGRISIREGMCKIDWAGVITISIAVIFLLIPISGGGAYFPWGSPMVISMLVIGVLSLCLFIFVEWRVARLPMMPLSIFKNPVIAVMLAQSFLVGAVYQSYLYYLPLYLQNARGHSVLASAAFTSALVGAQSVFSVAGGQYIARTKRYGEVIWFGFGSWTLGSCLTLLYTATTPTGLTVLPLLFVGAGVGCIFQPTLVAFQAHVTKPQRAVIIANRNFVRCAGGACGLAVSGAVLQAALRSRLPPAYAYLADKTYVTPPTDVLSGGGGGGGGGSPGPDAVLVGGAYVAASRAVFILQIPLIGLCLLSCTFIRDRGLQPLEDKPESGNDDGAIKDKELNVSVDELQQPQPQQTPLSKEEKAGALVDRNSKDQ
ncbi:major facilitator superfamily domain-containing protein [Apiospora arundinis]